MKPLLLIVFDRNCRGNNCQPILMSVGGVCVWETLISGGQKAADEDGDLEDDGGDDLEDDGRENGDYVYLNGGNML